MRPNFESAPRLIEESQFEHTAYERKDYKRRREVLKETVSAIISKADFLYQQAALNLERWRNQRSPELIAATEKAIVKVYAGDWGEIAGQLTKRYGSCFAVLNMANAYVPGGRYLQGAIAQEENMFRRSDCHFRINPNHLGANGFYKTEIIDLINGMHGRVFLDTANPRICIRGQEFIEREDLGYEWLSPDEIFPFYEMRSAAVNVKSGTPFSEDDCFKRISAQFNTLKVFQVKHVVLGAFGCGKFGNPPEKVAEIYGEVINDFIRDFQVISFAIFNAGYGPDNYTAFKNVLSARYGA